MISACGRLVVCHILLQEVGGIGRRMLGQPSLRLYLTGAELLGALFCELQLHRVAVVLVH